MDQRSTPPVARAARDGAILAGLLFSGYLFIVVAPSAGTFGFDAFAYWSVNVADPYSRTAGALGAFTYSPVVARLFAPFGMLALWQFLLLWDGLLVGTAVWLGLGSARSVLAILAFPAVALELYHGNVHLLTAAAIWLGFRYPAAWAFVLLTKVTPGVGLVWFAVRREWRSFAIALGVTGALVAASLAIDGRLWESWLRDSLGATATGAALNQFSLPVPLWIRVPAALALVAWGGLTSRRWTVPVGATLALPVLWPSGFAILAALWPILRERRHDASPVRVSQVRRS
jgi:Glycosyltransferase family 87